ncbi:Os09g0240500, partial [Oryza sativa Japonica Group]
SITVDLTRFYGLCAAVLGRLPGTTVYRNRLQYPEAYTYNGIVVVRIDAPIYFANISYIKDRLREYELNLPNSNRGPDVGRVYFVILEMSRKIFFLCYMI